MLTHGSRCVQHTLDADASVLCRLPRNLSNFHWEDGSAQPTIMPSGKGLTGPGYSHYGFKDPGVG